MRRVSMKKVTLIFAVVMTLVSGANVFAEEIDLSQYDDNAIVELLEQVQQEIVNRNIEKTALLAAGDYIGGRDLPAGTYLWTSMATGEDWGNITVYTLDENGSHDKQKLWEVAGAPEEGEAAESFLLTLGEGEELSSGVPFSLTIYAGAQFN